MPCGKKHNAMPSIPDPDSDSLTHSTPSSDIPSATPSSSPEDSLPAVGGGLSGAPPRWNGLAGWAMYFPGTSENDPACKGRAEVVSKVKHDLLNERFQQFLKLPANSTSVALDFQLLSQRSSPSALRSIAAALKKEPDFALASLGLAACRAAEDMLAQNAPDDSTMVAEVTHATKLCARIFNFSPFTALRLLKGTSVGTFVAVRGTVVRASTIRQQLVSMQFRCGRCGEDQTVDFADYKYTLPTACPTDKCRSRNFVPQRHTAITTDWQRIRIQEQQQRDQDDTGGAGVEEGRIPRTIDAELFGELIDSCLPGDVATVCGVVKVMAITEGGGGGGGPQSRGAAQSLYYMYIEANSVCTMRSRAGAAASSADTPEAATVHTVIHEVVREDDPFGFLVHSAVPSIYGHELVKAGMLLALFGGAPKLYKSNADSGGGGTAGNGNSHSGGGTSSSSSDQVSIRRDAHVLVVGDPGLGKSQMLKAFCNIAPRGVYICGNTSSTAGLTVTVVRDATGDFALEAGALVLGDGGVCCIDEFDKMGSEHGALLEAMEQQSVSVAKAGLLCNLSARTTVLAAANPVGGHYDRAKTVCENLKIALPLLSRFDFVFILMDKADMERDRFISEHVMRSFGRRSRARRRNNNATLQQPAVAWRGAARAGLHGDAAGAAAAATAATQAVAVARDAGTKSYGRLGGILTSGGGTDKDGYEEGEEEQNGLERRLQRMRVKDPLPPSLFREYVSYARTHVHPKLSTGAKSVLQDFYLELRRAAKEQAADTTPVTTRQLESMIRLSEARARAVMRTIVTAEDARDVVEIMRKCMVTELTDDTGVVDFGRASGMSRSSESRKFIAALDAEAKRKQSGSFSDADLRRVATAIGINGSRFNTIVESVNNQGFIIKKDVGIGCCPQWPRGDVRGSTKVSHKLYVLNPCEILDQMTPASADTEATHAVHRLLAQDMKPYVALGMSPPEGLLLSGPPGVGKTFAVFQVARKCDLQVYMISPGPDALCRLREAVTKCKEGERCVVFVDEIDDICPSSSSSSIPPTVALLNSVLDDNEACVGAFVIGATNRATGVNISLRRGGRIDKHVILSPPGTQHRLELLRCFTHDRSSNNNSSNSNSNGNDDDMDESILLKVAKLTPGYVAADLQALVSRIEDNLQKDKKDDTEKKTKLTNLSMNVWENEIRNGPAPSVLRNPLAVTSRHETSWDSIAGNHEAKRALQRAIEWPLRHSSSYSRLGMKRSHGVLLYGPPGCAKTSLIKAAACESHVPLLRLTSADIFSAFVGDSERMIRDTFAAARAAAPALLFLDEVDAFGAKRGIEGQDKGNKVQERVLAALLTEMDGVSPAHGVVVVAATNRFDVLDDALLRPGRFDDVVFVGLPNEQERYDILALYTKDMPIHEDVELLKIAKATKGYSGADLKRICADAALSVMREAMKNDDDLNETNLIVQMRHFPVK